MALPGCPKYDIKLHLMMSNDGLLGGNVSPGVIYNDLMVSFYVYSCLF